MTSCPTGKLKLIVKGAVISIQLAAEERWFTTTATVAQYTRLVLPIRRRSLASPDWAAIKTALQHLRWEPIDLPTYEERSDRRRMIPIPTMTGLVPECIFALDPQRA